MQSDANNVPAKEPAPAPFPVGIEIEYTGPYEAPEGEPMSLLSLEHGTTGLVVANHPGIPGRSRGTLGPNDPGFETVHGYSQVAYLCAAPVTVSAHGGRGGVRPADLFRNLEPEGIPEEVAQQRLAAYREYLAEAEAER